MPKWYCGSSNHNGNDKEMETQEIIFLTRDIKELAAICRGESDNYPIVGGDDSIDYIDEVMAVEGNLIDYLGLGNKVAPVVGELRQALREFLDSGFVMAVEFNIHRWHLTERARERVNKCFSEFHNDPTETVEEIAWCCEKWAHWIDLYFPPVEAATQQEARPKAGIKSAAAVRLESLQSLKEDLIEAGIIAGGQWQGSHAEFGCLVVELFEQKGVAHHGGRAWKDCAMWAGYSDDTEKARKAIEANPNTRGPIADKIRAICKAR